MYLKKFPKLKVGDVVYVEWEDHCTCYGQWTKVEDVFHHVCMVKTVGFVVLDGTDGLTVSLMMQTSNKVVSECITILKPTITLCKKINIKLVKK